MMNLKAEQLGLTATIFSNPHGLQNAMNVSSSKDLIILSHRASLNETFRKIMNREQHKYEYAEVVLENPELQSAREFVKVAHKEKREYIRRTKKVWVNTNSLLKKGWEGVKTGHTSTAGSCLSSLRDGIYIVVLNCKDN
jgi:D-alanyl-D-alanine carboxypeptidase